MKQYRRRLRSPEEIKKRVTGDIRKLNGRLLKTARRLDAEARTHRIAGTPPGAILTSFFRKAVNTFSGIEALKARHLVEEAWILLRVLLETYINFLYFAENDAIVMCQRYADAAILNKLKYLREVNFFEGSSLAAQNPRDKWEATESDIRSRYDAQELRALRRHGFSGKSVEARAKAVGLKSLYDDCYRIASRNVHMFDPAETPVARAVFRGRSNERRELLKMRRDLLESTQNMLLGRLSYVVAEFTKSHFASAQLLVLGFGYEKYRERKGSRRPRPDSTDDPPGTFRVWRD